MKPLPYIIRRSDGRESVCGYRGCANAANHVFVADKSMAFFCCLACGLKATLVAADRYWEKKTEQEAK